MHNLSHLATTEYFLESLPRSYKEAAEGSSAEPAWRNSVSEEDNKTWVETTPDKACLNRMMGSLSSKNGTEKCKKKKKKKLAVARACMVWVASE